MTENEITEIVIGKAIKVHKVLGPGLLESVYEECLYYELSKLPQLEARRQQPIPLIYEEVKLDCGYRADIIVGNKVIVEIKAVEALHDVFLAQTLTHMNLAKCKVGLLINFNVLKLIDGLKRIVNKF